MKTKYLNGDLDLEEDNSLEPHQKHASSVGLIRNLVTNNISPQYHVVYDNHFETAYAEEGEPPKEWEDLLFRHRELANFDE
jgi:hypothetical protein